MRDRTGGTRVRATTPAGVGYAPGDGQERLATYQGGACERSRRLDVEEGASQVRLRAIVIDTDEVCPAVGLTHTVTVRLAAPLGDRVLLDGDRTRATMSSRSPARRGRTTCHSLSPVRRCDRG